MTYDPSLRLHAPVRAEHNAKAGQRAKVVARLGVGGLGQDAEFDAFAAQTAAAFAAELGPVAQGLYAMANLVTDRQVFIGLHSPHGQRPAPRTMRLDQGWCPDVVDRGLALVLPDVLAWRGFSGNPAVESEIGIRAYAGAPVAEQSTGTVFGTVCVIGPRELPDATATVSHALIKARAAQLAALIEERTGHAITGAPAPPPGWPASRAPGAAEKGQELDPASG
ncbi:GAF domain-containing protein [Actinomadura syzygii]|uniref:GAF domain-containing protein n=1 Tax=Actinomadura syzygii TaxID=1427538 RepID=A0A5D0TSF9_9ACTN|nr:GAF domain-containing protein [Actinomadura syzygii]TYC08653.1 GAF domain-containing protein [Actinomadura syzygii]